MNRLEKIKIGLQSKNQDDWLTFEDIEYLIKKAEQSELWKQRFFEENRKLLDMIYEKTIR